MRQFDIYIAYISWGIEGKDRPVLVLAVFDEFVRIYQITTQYENKSDAIRSNYFTLEDWKQAGLNKPSYVDTTDTIDLPISTIAGKKPIGRLTQTDKRKLLDFLST